MKTGIELIAEERKRQIEKEGYTAEHDKRHEAIDLMDAARAYLITGARRSDSPFSVVALFWPWAPESFKSTTRIRDLEKAGALIAAAIDRIQAERQENRDRYMENQNQLSALTTLPETEQRKERP